jgi:hypothetical protein
MKTVSGIAVHILFVLLTLKCVYNLTVPYTLLRKKEGEGVSFMPYIELLLVVLAVAASFPASGGSWASHPRIVGTIAGGMVVGSYLHFVLVMLVGGWFLSRKKS